MAMALEGQKSPVKHGKNGGYDDNGGEVEAHA